VKSFLETATQIGNLVEEKNAAYGSSFAKAGDFLKLLYPDGLKPEQYTDALLLVRIFDKQMRIATAKDALGESPYRDIAGYGILGATSTFTTVDEVATHRHCPFCWAKLFEAMHWCCEQRRLMKMEDLP
jgi:hypothetical protein